MFEVSPAAESPDPTCAAARAHPYVAVQRVLRRNVYPRIGDRPLAAIRPSDVQARVAWMGTEQGSAPRTVRVAAVVAPSVFEAAGLDRRLVVNPSTGVRLPEVHKARVEPMTTDQVQMLALAVPREWRAAVVLGAGAGVRQGEMLGVTVDRIDFLRRTLTVDQQLLSLPTGNRSSRR